jgi:hypothetical protein
MGNLQNASIAGVCLVLFVATFLSGCAGDSTGGGYDSPRALIKAVHGAAISGDQRAMRLCVAPGDRDESPMDAALIALGKKYIRKVDVAAKLVEEKLGKDIATRFRRKSLWIMHYSPFEDPEKEGAIQWKRIYIRVEGQKAWVNVDGREAMQAVQNPAGLWFATVPKIKYSPQAEAYSKGLITGGIEDMDDIVRKLKSGKGGEERVLRRIMRNESRQGRRNAEVMINARTTQLLSGTQIVGPRGVRMLPDHPFTDGGFVTSITINSAMEQSNLEILYAHPIDTDVSISIDGGKAIKVRLPKTPHGGKDHIFASTALGPLSSGKHNVHVYTTRKSGVASLDWVMFVRMQPVPMDVGEEHQVIIVKTDKSKQGFRSVEDSVDANTAALLPGTKDLGMAGLRMLPANPFESGGFVASVTLKSELKNTIADVVYANPVDTEISITIDGGKPIRVKLPKTSYGGQNYTSESVAVGPLSKGKHKVHVYATHSSGVSKLGWVMFGPKQPKSKPKETRRKVNKTTRKANTNNAFETDTISLRSVKSKQGPRAIEASPAPEAAKLLLGTKAVSLGGVRMLPARPLDAGGFVAAITINYEMKNCKVQIDYANAVDTEISISIDGGKPIKVRLPKSSIMTPIDRGKHMDGREVKQFRTVSAWLAIVC